MEYITRDLQHKTKEILDKAAHAPVRIRRGGEFFEITKVKYVAVNEVEKNNSVADATYSSTGILPPFKETTVVEDNQEWVDVPHTFNRPIPQDKIDTKTINDLMASGLIKKGIK